MTVTPATEPEIVKVSAPVPPMAVNATEDSARPAVVMIAPPPESVTGGFTRMVMTRDAVTPAESVAVIVS